MIWTNRYLGHLFGTLLVYWVTLALGLILYGLSFRFINWPTILYGSEYTLIVQITLLLIPQFIAAIVAMLPYRWAAGRAWDRRVAWRDLAIFWVLVCVGFWIVSYVTRAWSLGRIAEIAGILLLIGTVGFVWNIWAHRRAQRDGETELIESFG